MFSVITALSIATQPTKIVTIFHGRKASLLSLATLSTLFIFSQAVANEATPVEPIEALPATKPDNRVILTGMLLCKDQINTLIPNGAKIPDIDASVKDDAYLFKWDRNIRATNNDRTVVMISAQCVVDKSSGYISKLSINGTQVI